MQKNLSIEQKVGVWEDIREIKNLMGRFTHAILFKEEETIFDAYWSTREDICYGTNEGWYCGPEAVKGYFMSIYNRVKKADEVIRARFPDLTAYQKPEDRGLGTVDVKALSNDLVEIAGDGKTAKGQWYQGGEDTMAEEFGPLYYYTFGVYSVDFVRENGEWKIWHMDYQEDIKHPMGQKWWEPMKEPKALEEFAVLAETPVAKPNFPEKRREYYTVTRQFQPFAPVPEPYETFAETFSYGK